VNPGLALVFAGNEARRFHLIRAKTSCNSIDVAMKKVSAATPRNFGCSYLGGSPDEHRRRAASERLAARQVVEYYTPFQRTNDSSMGAWTTTTPGEVHPRDRAVLI